MNRVAGSVDRSPNRHVQMELRGFDTFKPRTRGRDSGTTKDVVCWMIDTNHDGRSFFARHIHFPNAADDR